MKESVVEAIDWLENNQGMSVYGDINSIPIFVNHGKEPPAVTIAIPTFKRIDTLEYALKSALNQDYEDYEILVVDNNPDRDDDTERFMMRFSNNQKCSYYKNTKNIGLFGNWNRCFQLARTHWVTLLHDDDFYFPEYLSTMMNCLNNNPSLDALSCKYVYWKEDEHKTSIDYIDREAIPTPSGLSSIPKNAFLFTHPVGPIGLVFKRSIFLELGGFDEDYYPIADYVFNWRCFLRYNFNNLNVVLAHYRMGRNLSSKVETLEKQEVKGRQIRLNYIANGSKSILAKQMVEAYYRQQMQNLSHRFPNTTIADFKPISRWNLYLVFIKIYRKHYLRIRENAISRINWIKNGKN